MNPALPAKTPGKSRLNGGQARILVAPLDWGLGHATRCIPVIRELLAQDCEVWLAGEGAQQQLLQAEFPHCPFLPLQGYRIRYAKTKWGFIWRMLVQGPRMQRTIRYEQDWLKKMVSEHQLDAVISDNRYGLYHDSIPCVFITHQLHIKTSAGAWTERILQKRNYRYINRFRSCWVPDTAGTNNLAGDLSHPVVQPVTPVDYIGWLSRFEQKGNGAQPGHLLVLLSGPEPQRSILEEKIIRDIAHYNGTATVVRGLPGSASLVPSTGMIQFYNHLPAEALNEEMEKASLVISRSGYSTVMDIMQLQKKSILIPTPWQTEQEYLGTYLQQQQRALCIPQKDFSLSDALAAAASFDYKLPERQDGSVLPGIIRRWTGQSLTPALG